MENKMGPALEARFESLQPGEMVDVDIFLKQKASIVLPNIDDLLGDQPDTSMNRNDRIAAIKKAATESQSELLSYLAGEHPEIETLADNTAVPSARVKQTFWINNSIAAEVTCEVLNSILTRDDVAHVELRRDIKLEDMLDGSTSPLRDIETTSTRLASAIKLSDKTSATGASGEGPTPTDSLKLINAPVLWQESLTGEGVIVAIVDSGVNYDHPDLKNQMWDGGALFPHHGNDFLAPDDDPQDDDPAHAGHGTACAGLIAGNGTSGTITGVAPKATIMAVRVGESLRAIYDGLIFAIEHGADVINLSLTEKHAGPFGITTEPDNFGWRATCENILASMVLHANSTGKNGTDTVILPIPVNIGPPGSCPPPRLHALQIPRGGVTSAISCGATDDNDVLDGPSGKGPVAWDVLPFVDYPFTPAGAQGLTKPDLCAPGLGSTTCNSNFTAGSTENPYVTFTGTSAATAYVSGCLALLVQACKRSGKPVVAARIQEALEESAKPIQGQTKKKENNFGAGRVDIYEAFEYGKKRAWWQ